MKKKLNASVLSLCTLAILSSACNFEKAMPFKGKQSNRVTNKSRHVNTMIGDDKVQLQVVGSDVIKSLASPVSEEVLNSLPQGNKAAPSVASEAQVPRSEDSLVLGLPLGLIGEQNIFGGVITKVSDKKSETLGGLKLTDLSPLNVRTVINRDGEDLFVTLVGCPSRCEEDSDQLPLINFPIVGYNQETNMLMVDLSAIGNELNLVAMLDPKGEYTKLKTVSSVTTSLDYSYSTLVFDVQTKMIPVTADSSDTSAPVTEFSVRWYLKLNSVFNPAYKSRAQTPGVGFFTTERSADTKITRFSTTAGTNIHYFIKNVPQEFRKIFAGALDNWNVEFKKVLGRDLLTYEFLEQEDPRHAQIIPGDIRFNVIEWDLENLAGYGGLGPSIANQFTGETLSANVLIQGPKIVELYTKWFGVSKRVEELKANGLALEAATLMKKFNKKAQKELAPKSGVKLALKLGAALEMTIHAQRPELQDPIYKGHFELVPQGISYEEYMTGYFGEMLAHELGHNLGLRHNFKGNLGAFEDQSKGSVSRSIMEYMGRPFRHLNAIGAYDKMAIAYGYKGVAPKHLTWFCTDEDQGTNAKTLLVNSAECTKSDATSDPYSFFEGRLARALDMLIDMKSARAPIWKVSEVKDELEATILGLSSYALSAAKTSDTWTNFFGKGDRPEVAADVKPYVLLGLKKKLCSEKVAAAILGKESAEAQELAKKNLEELQKTIAKLTEGYGLFKAQDIACK